MDRGSKGVSRAYPCEKGRAFRSETSFTPAVLLALQIQRTDYDDFIYLFFWQNKRQLSLKCGSKQLNENTRQVRIVFNSLQ